jgi:hypothetical protein
VGWTHPYAPLGTPLVDRDLAQPTIAAWLDHLALRTDLPKLMLLPLCPIEGAFAQAFDSALARRGDRCVLFGTHRRALLMPADERASYVERAVGSKKLKELRRQKRRLGDAGVVMWSIASESAALASALQDFLDLEAGGWKGRAGTAAKSDPEIRAFMEAAVPQLACDGKARIARLFLDARPIAAIILLRSGDTEWCWKIAYDESVAQASPGVQILIDVTQALLDDMSVTRADSCATPDHPMIDHIWRERLALSDRLIGVSPAGAASFALARALETGRGALVAAAKRTRHLLRR